MIRKIQLSSPNTKIKIFAALLGVLGFFTSCSQENFGVEPVNTDFAQSVTYTKLVDVLWVLDTSGSMDQHRAEMAAQAPAFIESMNKTGLDYQMAMTSMDMSATGEQGHFIAQAGTPYILNSQTPNLDQVLSDRLSIPLNGSPLERGEEGMKSALDKVGSSSTNQGFLRPNSLLVVIFLTDEDDSSATFDYKGYLDSVRPALPTGARSWVAQFMGVMPNDPSCLTSLWGYSSPGTRYIQLAQGSGGITQSICDLDFAQALTNVKARILEVVTQYFLGRPPVPSTIVVTVGGQVVAADPYNGWTYDATSNSVTFHGTAIPKPGAVISVNYDPAGLQ